jgi:hypothetical protein
VYAGVVVVLTRDLVVLNTYAGRGEPPTTGKLVVSFVIVSLLILWSVVILANVGGFRDGFVRRVLTQRSMFSPDPASVLTPERIKSATRSLIFVVTVVLLGEIFFAGLFLTMLV